MLAYVFWHWRRFGVSSGDYEKRLVGFHRAMKDSPPAGFTWSACLAVSNEPWANDGKDAYEDWYCIENISALDSLNDAAISAARQAPHDAAAAVVQDGAAGIYRVKFGQPQVDPLYAHWFGKPDGWPYEKLYGTIEPLARGGSRALWKRQMALGPAREFCLHAREQLTLPTGIVSETIKVRSVFPERV
jgi:hypothetical protein